MSNNIQKLSYSVILLSLSMLHSFLLVTSQILFKVAQFDRSKDELLLVLAVITNPMVISGVICFIGSSLCWLLIVKKYDFSVAYPLVSLNNVFAIAYSIILLHEFISVYKVIGVLLIMTGVVVISYRGHGNSI